ncbi:MAG: DUF1893 domain-containing protein [Bacteroides sp.]|nr:DUF1893 domain-containing protein [Prevotella sp.]MCM1408723.1 DUF1893 domain-containing protein [Treponema brennaborense]MCM1470638.1 DUF1893 domain-containing protein [Bacteroides sp.]
MNQDAIKAKELFSSGKYTCVLVKDGVVHTSVLTGIAPLLAFIENGTALEGFSAADKIVGKAAALLFTFLGIKELYTPVLSEAARGVLEAHGILYHADTIAEEIINRSGTGCCPMECAVRHISEPKDAVPALKNALSLLRAKSRPDT